MQTFDGSSPPPQLRTVGGEKLIVHRRGNLVVISGCITTVCGTCRKLQLWMLDVADARSPMKQKANFDLTVGQASRTSLTGSWVALCTSLAPDTVAST